ncbi:MAG: hypothetical protein ACRC6B_06540, partial [Fusobacteriaceae bacterium]
AMAFRTAASSGIEFCSSPEAIRTWLGASASGGDATYVKKAGDTMTGNLLFSNSGTAWRGIQGTMADNDMWRIGGAGTASNAGYMEIATADDSSEPIYVRQYTGAFTSLTRTATLLDASGNTQFPGIVTSANFSLNGSARTFSLNIGNTAYTHYSTTADEGHWFNKNVRVQGDIYCGPSYNQLVWSTANLAFGTGNGNMARGDHTHTAAQVGLGSVSNWGSSSAIGANSVSQYATTNMVAQVRAEKVNKGGDTMTGVLTLKTPALSASITNTTANAVLNFGYGSTPTTGVHFMPMTTIGLQHSGGYVTRVTTGAVKLGTSGWGDGVSGYFVGVGGADANPTEYFTLAYGGKIKHSRGHEFYSTIFKPNSTDVGLGNVGNYSAVNKGGDTMTGALGIAAGAAQLATSTPTQLSYGLLGAYGTLRILANTDNIGSEPVLIASAQGLTTDVNSGLAVYPTWMNFRGNKVYHAGDKPSAADVGALPTANPTFTGNLNVGGGSGYMTGGGDGASSTVSNVTIRSWFGIGFGPTISGQPIPQNQNACYINVRNGDFTARGNISGARTYNAVWNDYAEYFPKRKGYTTEAGDIIALSQEDDEEIYVLATENHDLIVGAHSDQYGHLIGGEEPAEGLSYTEHNDSKYIPVGLVGRLPVKFIGIARKGMKVVPSHIPGVGRAFDNSKDNYDKVIGYIVENNDEEGIRRVKIKIGK